MNDELKRILELYAEELVEVIEDGNWKDGGKYSYCNAIVEHAGKYYEIQRSRSGSYFTDYDYNIDDVYEVEKFEKTVVQTFWHRVNPELK